MRHIRSIHISERVVQRTLCDKVINPTLKPSFIYDNGASTENKGIDFAFPATCKGITGSTGGRAMFFSSTSPTRSIGRSAVSWQSVCMM